MRVKLIFFSKAACTILSIDETVRNPKSEEAQRMKKAGGMPRKAGGGMPGMGGIPGMPNLPGMRLK